MAEIVGNSICEDKDDQKSIVMETRKHKTHNEILRSWRQWWELDLKMKNTLSRRTGEVDEKKKRMQDAIHIDISFEKNKK